MRNNALDAAKLVAAFFIIAVHVGFYNEFSDGYGNIIRISSRWALPFFFLASGYFIGLSKNIDIERRINKIISIIFYSLVLFAPVIYVMQGSDFLRFLIKIFSNDTINNGAFFHLWFLNALVIGIIGLGYAVKNCNALLSIIIALLFIAGCWVGDITISLGYKVYVFYAFRTLIAYSLVYLGYFFAKNATLCRIKISHSIFFIFIGILLMIAEPVIMNKIYGSDIKNREFPIMCVPVCISLLSLCVNVRLKDNFISMLGMNYSLGIYIIHPFVLFYFRRYSGLSAVSSSTVNLLFGFICSILILMLLKKFIPIAYNKLNGIGVS